MNAYLQLFGYLHEDRWQAAPTFGRYQFIVRPFLCQTASEAARLILEYPNSYFLSSIYKVSMGKARYGAVFPGNGRPSA